MALEVFILILLGIVKVHFVEGCKEIGLKGRESNYVIIPNHKPLKGSLSSCLHLTIQH